MSTPNINDLDFLEGDGADVAISNLNGFIADLDDDPTAQHALLRQVRDLVTHRLERLEDDLDIYEDDQDNYEEDYDYGQY